VAVITEAAIRELAGIRGDHAPITSCYLDVDGRRLARHQDLEQELDATLRDARQRANGHRSVHDDLRRIEAHVKAGLDRSATRGLAIFACSASGLWEVIELPVPVRTQVVINHAPAVGQLESLLQEREPIGVLLADRQRARLLVFEQGVLTDRSDLIDELPRDYDTRGERERGTPDAHVEELAHQHLRNAARAAFDLWQARGFAHLAIGAPEPLANELEAGLHPYLRERLCGRIRVTVAASPAEVMAAAEQVEDGVERRKEALVVDRLREAAITGRRGVAGLGRTLEALHDHRVERLVVSKGYAEEGWRCPETDALAIVGPTNPINGARMVKVPNVVEDAIEEALAQGLPVTICCENADLDVLGRVGALLRY
jgi:peptide subunit release factor 1 (eRF1)